ncbi:hypothetical protein PFLL34_03601 [Pseudomonas fluorescens]|uniref:hypothetical protein n=1 Tax=Pseudomonas TaxID=286 RepID=UPI000762D414|nr:MULTISPECIES: hypothetical protein [Pseudomonas]KWV82552.1 hypothetical protein PFLL34_03601 [Pseudomonas fluorescens]MBW9238312.1 hypothetical protein [Pseudomonas carnis]
MTTNQTIDGVPRGLLENFASYAEGSASGEVQQWVKKLRALLDAPANFAHNAGGEQKGVVLNPEGYKSEGDGGGDFLHWSNDHAEVEGAPLRVGAGVTIENVGCASEEGRKPILVFDAAKGHLTEVNLVDISLVSKRRAHTLNDLKDIGVRVEQPAPVAVDVLITGFYTTESGGGKYAINIGFRSMADMQAADAQLRELLKSR